MAKHGKNPHRTPFIAKSQGEKNRAIKTMGAELSKLVVALEAQRRLVWMLVHDRGGRVEIDRDAYKANVKLPMTDCIVRLDDDKQHNVVVLSECDEKGEPVSKIVRLPGS